MSRQNKNKKKQQKQYLHQTITPQTFYGVFLSFVALVLFGAGYFSASTSRAAALIPNQVKSVSQLRFEASAQAMTAGHPIEAMLPNIFEQDVQVAAYLVSIAKKESNWGKVAPQKKGKDCFNYWGFTGEGSRGFAMGHGCFGSKEEAVTTVAARIHELVYTQKRVTPRQMIVWKCGYSCAGHSPESVEKWIADVGYYRAKLQTKKKPLQQAAVLTTSREAL
jgi:hypothetical protein